LKRSLANITALAGAAILVLALYSPARSMSFYFDDRVTILLNEKIQSASPLTAFAENPFRGLVNLTFWVQLQLHRPDLPPAAHDLKTAAPNISRRFYPPYGRDLFYYRDPQTKAEVPVSVDPGRGLVFALPPALPFRLLNLIIHLANAALLALIVARLRPGRPWLAALAAFAFLTAPIATESVNYITARFGLMATAFSLAAILAHLHADDQSRWDLAALGAFLAALLCKESAAVLPLIAFILDAARGGPRARALWALAGSLLYGLLRSQWQIELGPATAQVPSWYAYLLLQQRVLWLYLAKVIFPLHLNFENYLVPDLLKDFPFALLNAVLLYASALILHRAWKRTPEDGRWTSDVGRRGSNPESKTKNQKPETRNPKPQTPDPKPKTPDPKPQTPNLLPWSAAIILMIWIALAPTSSVLALDDLVREERAYALALILLPALVIALAPRLWSLAPAPRRVGAAALAVILIWMSALTCARNRAWTSELALARDAAAKSPNNPRAVYNYANALKWAEHYRDALNWFQLTLELDADRADAQSNLDALRAQLSRPNP
jgi:hypothetical protein